MANRVHGHSSRSKLRSQPTPVNTTVSYRKTTVAGRRVLRWVRWRIVQPTRILAREMRMKAVQASWRLGDISWYAEANAAIPHREDERSAP
jgi:hypothetical protein